MAALTGLGTLGELDLQVRGVHQVVARHAEARRGDLLDLAAQQRVVEAFGRFAALAGVRARADRVHRDRKRLMRFLRDGAVAHRAGREALDDLGGRFDLVDADRFTRRIELHQAAQRHEAVRRVVDVVCVLLEHRVVAALRGLLQQEDRLGVVEVLLAGAAPLVVAAGAQVAVRRGGPLVRIGHTVADRHLFRQIVKATARDTRDGAGEVVVDHRVVEADGLEQLGATIAHDRRDAHLAHDLEHAGRQRVAQVGDGLLLADRQEAVTGQVLDGFERKVRVDSGRAVRDEQCHMVDLTHIAGFDDHRDLRARLAAQQVVLHGRGEQKRRDRRHHVVRIAVGQDQEVLAVFDGRVDLGEDLIEALTQGVAATGDLVQALDGVRAVVAVELRRAVEALELRHLVRGDDRLFDEDLLGVQRAVVEQVRLGADRGLHRGDDLLTLPVERRVRDLRELLREVVEQHAAAAGQHRHRGVVAH